MMNVSIRILQVCQHIRIVYQTSVPYVPHQRGFGSANGPSTDVTPTIDPEAQVRRQEITSYLPSVLSLTEI